MASPGRCYVSMPLGKRALPTGEVDFDLLYHNAISPAVNMAGLTPLRTDTLVTVGSGERAVIEAIARAEVMIADLSTADPNVCYELGMRHALAPRTTLLLLAEGSPVPLNLLGLHVLRYSPPGASVTALDELRTRLVESLQSRDGYDAVDSPFYQLFPVEPITLPDDPLGLRRRRRTAEALRARLLQVRQLLPEDGIPRLQELERDIAEAGLDDDRMRMDLMLAYRNFAAWDDCIRVISQLPKDLAETPAAVQQNALAHNRRGLPGDADRAAAALRELIERIGPDSETYGLLGRIYKDRYQRTGERSELDAAIDAYRRGWEADPQDVYPGINLVTLLTRAGGESELEEVRRVVPQLRRVVDERLSSPTTDYWDIATALELAALDRDWKAADELVAETRARAAVPWMLETTVNNLRILTEALPAEHDRRKMEQLVRSLAPEVIAR